MEVRIRNTKFDIKGVLLFLSVIVFHAYLRAALRVKIRLSKDSPSQKPYRRKAASGRRKVISDDEADYDSKDDVS